MTSFSTLENRIEQERKRLNRAVNVGAGVSLLLLIPVVLALSAKFPLYPIFPFYPLFNIIVAVVYTASVFMMLHLLDRNKRKNKEKEMLKRKEIISESII